MSEKRSGQERDMAEGRANVNPVTGEMYATTTWRASDLEPYKRGEQVIAPPQYLRRDDGRALIYPGKPHTFFGPTETLKTFAAILACADVISQGGHAVYVDFENDEALFVERCRLVGIPDDAIGRALRYVRPIQPLKGDAAFDFWYYEVEAHEPALVVMDGVTECFALHGWNIDKATDVATYQRSFAFSRGGVASIAIDHTSKDAGRGALGSQHKAAGLNGAEYQFESLRKGGLGKRAVAKVSVTKDRHGHIRAFSDGAIGYLVVDSGPDTVAARKCVYLEAPKLAHVVDPKSDAIDRVELYIQQHPGESGSAIARELGMQKPACLEVLGDLEMLGRIRNASTTYNRKSWVAV